MRLKGKVLKKEENSSDSDYSGSGYYYEKVRAIYLYEDHTFLYEEKTNTIVRAGDLSRASESPNRQEGTWKMEFRNESPHLVLRQPDDSVFREWAVKDGGVGVEYLDGVAWNRHKIA